MKAYVQRGHGGPEVCSFEHIDDPTPGPDEVVIGVLAAGLNRLELLQRTARSCGASAFPMYPVLTSWVSWSRHTRRRRRTRPSRRDGVEDAEIDRRNERPVRTETLDDTPHRTRWRWFEITPRPALVGHGMALLELGIGRVDAHGSRTIFPKNSELSIFSWASAPSRKANTESTGAWNEPPV